MEHQRRTKEQAAQAERANQKRLDEHAEIAGRANQRAATIRFGLTAFLLLAVVSAAGYFGYAKYQAHQRAERQRAVDSGIAALQAVHAQWADASKLASSTSRIALSGPVGKLQEVHRNVVGLQVPACLVSARDNFALGVKSEIDAFLVFMSDREYEKNVEFATKRLAAQRAIEAHALFIREPIAPCKEFVRTGRESPA